MDLTPEDIKILRHALGVDWAVRPYRRHYIAPAFGLTRERCDLMADEMLLARFDEPDRLGMQCYHVTELGARAVGQRLPR